MLTILYFVLLVLLLHPTAVNAQATVPRDWLISNQLMRAKNHAAALPYLEKLVRDYPDVVLYRLDLGYALYLLGRDSRARFHFQQARGANLTAEQRSAVDSTLGKIAARKVWSVRLGFSLEPATNAGKGTAAGTVNIGGIAVPIPGTLRTKPATGVFVNAGVSYQPRLSPNLEATFSLDSLIKHYTDRSLRETLVVGRAGLRWSPDLNTYLEGGFLVGTSYVAGANYNDHYGVFGSYSAPLGARASARIGFEHYRMTYDTFTLATGTRSQIEAQLVYALTANSLLRARGFLLRTNATGALQSGWRGALTLGGTYAFRGGLTALLDITSGIDQRDGTSRLTGVRRTDRSFAAQAEFFNSKYQIGQFSPVLRLKIERNKSNQVLNSYTNRSISVGLRASF